MSPPSHSADRVNAPAAVESLRFERLISCASRPCYTPMPGNISWHGSRMGIHTLLRDDVILQSLIAVTVGCYTSEITASPHVRPRPRSCLLAFAAAALFFCTG